MAPSKGVGEGGELEGQADKLTAGGLNFCGTFLFVGWRQDIVGTCSGKGGNGDARVGPGGIYSGAFFVQEVCALGGRQDVHHMHYGTHPCGASYFPT